MGVIEHDDIVGVSILNGYTYCLQCMGEVSDYEEKDIILESEVEDAECTYWCDLCGEAFK